MPPTKILLPEKLNLLTSIFTSTVHSCHTGTLFTASPFLHAIIQETGQRKLWVVLNYIRIQVIIWTEHLWKKKTHTQLQGSYRFLDPAFKTFPRLFPKFNVCIQWWFLIPNWTIATNSSKHKKENNFKQHRKHKRELRWMNLKEKKNWKNLKQIALRFLKTCYPYSFFKVHFCCL